MGKPCSREKIFEIMIKYMYIGPGQGQITPGVFLLKNINLL